METFLACAVIVAIVGSALLYVIKAKKSGKKCIGCPDGCCSSAEVRDGGCSCCCGSCGGCPSRKNNE